MESAATISQRRAEAFVNFVCFLLLATAGMASVAMVFIADPVAQYYADQAVIDSQKQKLQELREIYNEQQMLINNKDNPSVLERAAIRHLKYRPADLAHVPPQPLGPSWQELEFALSETAPLPNPAPAPKPNPYRSYAEILAHQPDKQFILAVFGGLLVLIALTCFNRRSC